MSVPVPTDLVIAGRYRVFAEIGRGAMGAVWLVEHVAESAATPERRAVLEQRAPQLLDNLISLSADLAAKTPRISSNVEQMTSGMNRLFSPENTHKLEDTIDNADRTAANLAELTGSLHSSKAKVDSLLATLDKVAGDNEYSIYFVAPTLLKMKEDILEHLREHNIWYTEETDLDKVLPEVDVVYQTRIQKERKIGRRYSRRDLQRLLLHVIRHQPVMFLGAELGKVAPCTQGETAQKPPITPGRHIANRTKRPVKPQRDQLAAYPKQQDGQCRGQCLAMDEIDKRPDAQCDRRRQDQIPISRSARLFAQLSFLGGLPFEHAPA